MSLKTRSDMATGRSGGDIKAAPTLALNAEARALRITSAFGQIITVLMRSRRHRVMPIGDLEWLVAPAVATGQYALAEMRDPRTLLKTPVGVVLWATVSDEVDKRLCSALKRPLLAPNEWVSGPIPWLIDAGGNPRATATLMRQLVGQRFASTGLKTLDFEGDKPSVRILTEIQRRH